MLRECILRTQRLIVTSWLARDVDDLSVVHSDVETMRFVRQGRPRLGVKPRLSSISTLPSTSRQASRNGVWLTSMIASSVEPVSGRTERAGNWAPPFDVTCGGTAWRARSVPPW